MAKLKICNKMNQVISIHLKDGSEIHIPKRSCIEVDDGQMSKQIMSIQSRSMISVTPVPVAKSKPAPAPAPESEKPTDK